MNPRRDKASWEISAAWRLFRLNNAWALRRGLTHEPRMDERTVAMGVRPAP
jgi:hypothetical protein